MSSLGFTLTSAQETDLCNRFDQDENLGLVFFTLYLRSKGEGIEKIKEGLFGNTALWMEEVNASKTGPFEDVKQLIEKTLQWNIRIKQFMADGGLVNILKCYLRSLIGLRSKKNNSDSALSSCQRQINNALAQVAGDLSVLVEPYQEMTRCLERNQTPGGKDLTDVSKAYYLSRQNEFFNLISTFLALILSLKLVSSQDELVNCQDLIRRNLVRPLELRIDNLDKNDKKEAWAKLDSYSKLVHSLELNP